MAAQKRAQEIEFPVDLVRRMLALTQEQKAHLTQVHQVEANIFLQGILRYCDWTEGKQANQTQISNRSFSCAQQVKWHGGYNGKQHHQSLTAGNYYTRTSKTHALSR